MKSVKLHLDMADQAWFEPYTTIVAEVDTSDVVFFYPRFGREIRIARLRHNGRELVVYSLVENAWSWSAGFGAIVADMGEVSWSEALERNFEGVSLEARGKAVVRLDPSAASDD